MKGVIPAMQRVEEVLDEIADAMPLNNAQHSKKTMLVVAHDQLNDALKHLDAAEVSIQTFNKIQDDFEEYKARRAEV